MDILQQHFKSENVVFIWLYHVVCQSEWGTHKGEGKVVPVLN
jgi:hypothetical protein